MKKIFFLIVILSFLFFTGCFCDVPTITLSHIQWYTTTEKIGDLTFGFVHLSISGATSGDKITVITYGDGVIEEYEIALDQNNQFDEDVTIAFTHIADDEPRTYSTTLTAYKCNCLNKKSLVSEELTYLKKK